MALALSYFGLVLKSICFLLDGVHGQAVYADVEFLAREDGTDNLGELTGCVLAHLDY